MEDPSSQNLLLQFVLLFILTVLNAFFSATEMAMVSLNRARVEQKAEEGDRRYIRLLKVLENPNHFLSIHSSRDYLDYNLIRGEFSRHSGTRNCILAWKWRNSLCRCKFFIFGIFDLYFHRFWRIVS